MSLVVARVGARVTREVGIFRSYVRPLLEVHP
jgi:hypothetical protein